MTVDPLGSPDPRQRLHQHARYWRVQIDSVRETASSVVGFGRRGCDLVVLKVAKRHGDEWLSGPVIRAFDGCGVVRALEDTEGAVLLERLAPAHPLTATVGDDDDAAVEVVATLIARMGSSDAVAPPGTPSVHDWGRGFRRYLDSRDQPLPRRLVERAYHEFSRLADSQRQSQLLHGDLHHDNVLFDSMRGWTVIDPKGVTGEVEYEIGAFLRNPTTTLHALLSPADVERRIRRFADRLDIDAQRTLHWGFAQAVLSLLWSLEDGDVVADSDPVLLLATSIEAMLSPL
jgi:streptomycin 6-kinase